MRVRVGSLFAALLLLALSLADTATLSAQETSRIVGRVVAAEGGAAIAGAVVEVVGTTMQAQSGIDGRYTLLRVPAGTVSLRAKYIGYQQKVVTGVVVPAGGVVSQDISLSVQVVELEEISVAAVQENGSVNQALEDQRNAVNVINTVTAEQIAKSPDGDAGQAVQRVSGVTVQDGKYVFVRGLGERYTTTSLNGARIPSPEPERKVVPLDIFPSGLLEGITTSKTFTPDQPGDFSGAQVNLTTREFPARRVITFSTGAGFNTSATGKTLAKAPTAGREWLGFAGSARRIPSALEQAGSLAGSTRLEMNQYIASLRDVWSARRGDGTANGGFGLSIGGEDPIAGQRIGYLGSFNYGYSQEVREDEERALATTGGPINQYRGGTTRGSVLWGGLLNLSTRIGSGSKLSLNNTYTRSADNEAISLHGVAEEFTQYGELAITRLTFTERTVRSHQLHGEHLIGGSQLFEWSATASKTRRYEPDRSDLTYQARVDSATGVVTPFAWAPINQSATRTFSDINETNYDLGANYRITFGSSTSPSSIKFGSAYRYTDRNADSRAYDIQNFDLTSAELQVPAEQLFSSANALAGRFVLTPNANVGQYTANDKVLAGFVQTEIPLTSRIRFVGGARVERWALDLVSTTVTGIPEPVSRRNTDILPAAALNIRLSESQNLRLSATETLSRPEYRELSRSPSFDILGGLVTFGDTSLKRALIQNFDARWEWYPRAGEVLSVGLFAKRFDNPIERVLVATTGASSLSFVNAERANNFGVELEVRKSLRVVAAALANLTVFSNASFIHSRITPGNSGISALTNANRPMVGQAGYVVNAGLGWTDGSGRWSATGLFNVVGRRISEAGQNPLPDTYEEARAVVDVSLQAPVFSTLTLKLQAKNLLNSAYDFRQGDVTRLHYRAGRVFGFGLSWQP